MQWEQRTTLRRSWSAQPLLERRRTPSSSFNCPSNWRLGVPWMLQVRLRSACHASMGSHLLFASFYEKRHGTDISISSLSSYPRRVFDRLSSTWILISTYPIWASSPFLSYSDNVGGVRTLANGVAVQGLLTNAKCTEACFNAGYPLSGSEYANECCTWKFPPPHHPSRSPALFQSALASSEVVALLRPHLNVA